MKKFIVALLSIISLSAVAAENVTIVYAFGVGDKQANYYRNLIQEANKSQNKYHFLFDVKPGAGSTVAAKHVLKTPNTILATSSAHFIRPNFYPNESHNIDDYQSLLPMCNIPVVVSSIKYKTWQDVPKNRPLTIGVSGAGSATHLTSLQVKTLYPELEAISYKGPSESLSNMVGGLIDFNVGFLSDIEQWPSVNVLGTTGSTRVGKNLTLVEKGFPSVLGNMDNPQHLVVPANMNSSKYQGWREILLRASKSSAVRDSYKSDFCKPLEITEVAPWYHSQKIWWAKIASTVTLDK
jgi:tripartite-type tricarboxylate transporter receptor subunit TctC